MQEMFGPGGDCAPGMNPLVNLVPGVGGKSDVVWDQRPDGPHALGAAGGFDVSDYKHFRAPRMAPPGPVHAGPSAAAHGPMGPAGPEWAHEFRQMPHMPIAGPRPMPPGVVPIGRFAHMVPPFPAAMADEYLAGRMADMHMQDPEARAQFEEYEQLYRANASAAGTSGWVREYGNRSWKPAARPAEEGSWAAQYQEGATEPQSWADQYREGPAADADAEELRALSRAVVDSVDDPKLKNSNLMRFLKDVSDGSISFQDGKVVHEPKEEGISPFDPSWDNIFHGAARAEAQAPRHNWGEWPVGEYEFAVDNPYRGRQDAYDVGFHMLSSGNISEAILAFEAEVQARPSSQAWQMLGMAHAENDKDYMAILALEKAVALDAHNNDALLALAVSYTNESNKQKALEVLQGWLRNHPDYQDMDFRRFDVPRPDPLARALESEDASDEAFYEQFSAFWNAANEQHARVTDMFIEAARRRADNLDADVQVALGVLYNLSHEYDKAAECFMAALSARPDDYLLWNKLGATLANSSKSQDALGAYYKSLSINPSYVRAKVNLAISYSNLRQYKDAATHYLGALNMQPGGARVSHIWHLLRMALSMMERPDLVALSDRQDVEVFRREFEF